MNSTSLARIGSPLAAFVGLGGLLYGLLFALIVRGTSDNVLRAWLVLGILGGIAASGVFVALYERLKATDPFLAAWGLVLGVTAGLGQMLNASVGLGYDISGASGSSPDPLGILRFALNGFALLLFGWVLAKDRSAPPMLGRLALVGGLLLVVMYVGRIAGFITPADKASLIPPFLYGVIVHPVFYLWLARHLRTPSSSLPQSQRT